MARFYARFDNAAETPLANDAFDYRTIAGGSSASGALLRDGLIASRSAVSNDIFEELDVVNRNGAQGTYFPPDLLVVTSGVLTGSAYTSSVAGVIIPADYRTRPTGSITSSQSTLVGPTNPLDSASVNYNVYLSASTAVRNTVDNITGGGPYARLGLNSSRTLHALWHDVNLQYFAWDDFTPGTAQSITTTVTRPALYADDVTTSQSVAFVDILQGGDVQVKQTWTNEFLADSLGTTDFTASLITLGTTRITLSSSVSNAPSGSVSFTPWAGTWDNQGSQPNLKTTASVTFSDITIPSHRGTQAVVSGDILDEGTPVIIQAIYPRSASVHASDPCNVGATDEVVYTNTNAFAPARVYSDTVGNIWPVGGGTSYAGFYPLISGQIAYEYQDGKPTGNSVGITCNDSGGAPCVSVTTTVYEATSDTDCTTTTPVTGLYSAFALIQGGSYIYTENTCTTPYSATTYVRLFDSGNTVHSVDANGRLSTPETFVCADE